VLNVKLYRAVSEAEFHDLIRTGKFRQTPRSLEGKWFAVNAEDAARWGNALQGLGNYRIIEVEAPEKIAEQFFRVDWLDNIGPAMYAELDELGNVNFREAVI
jgi:hypothetical protein